MLKLLIVEEKRKSNNTEGSLFNGQKAKMDSGFGRGLGRGGGVWRVLSQLCSLLIERQNTGMIAMLF